jgi:hypothetical protein
MKLETLIKYITSWTVTEFGQKSLDSGNFEDWGDESMKSKWILGK